MFSRLPLIVGFVFLTGLRIFAAQDTQPVNADALLKELDRIEQTQKQTALSARQSASAQIKAAAASGTAAAALYEQAVEAMQFDGTKNKGSSLSDWKSSKAALLRSKEMQAILMFHLRYLALSMDRKGSDKPELFVQPAYEYITDLASFDPRFVKLAQKGPDPQNDREREDAAFGKEITNAKKEFLDRALTDSIFVKWLHLQSYLPKGDDWELNPGNISGILEKDIRPVYRKTKDARLIDTYEFETKILADRVTSSRLDHDAGDFNTITLPQILLARAEDMILIGQRNRGITEIYSLIKTYPQHPDFSKWVQRLRELLKTPAGEAPAAGSAPAPATPSSAGPGTAQP